MKYLVTGIAGFIASRTAEMLLEQGHQVVGVDNLNDYYDVRLKTYRLYRLAELAGADADILKGLDYTHPSAKEYPGPRQFTAGNLAFEQLDVENKPRVLELFREHQFDAVLNLAARAGVRYSMENPDVYLTTNTMAPLHLLDGMKETGVKKFVLASTSSLYAGQKMPFTEDLPVNTPISPYAASKKAAEAISYTYHHLYGIDVSVLRYFTVYGPAGRPDMSPLRFLKWIDEGTPIQLFGDGTQARDFTYVDDIALGTIAALKPVGFEVVNLGGGQKPITINFMIETFEQLLGKKAVINHRPFHSADMDATSAEITKAERLIDWRPVVSFDDGMTRLHDWYVLNRNWLHNIQH